MKITLELTREQAKSIALQLLNAEDSQHVGQPFARPYVKPIVKSVFVPAVKPKRGYYKKKPLQAYPAEGNTRHSLLHSYISRLPMGQVFRMGEFLAATKEQLPDQYQRQAVFVTFIKDELKLRRVVRDFKTAELDDGRKMRVGAYRRIA